MATVLLTGASGFLGIHTVHGLLASGHRVRALVRSESRLEANLRPLELAVEDPRLEVAVGDMTDAAAVRDAADGCDAVVHAAATFSYRRRDRRAMLMRNALGTRTVLEAARDAGCAPVVHVSSTVALATPGGDVLDHASPLGPGMGPYTSSKVASEAVARDLLRDGAPVTIVNPGAIIGPHDPYLGESNELIVNVLRGRLPAWPRGLLHVVDVRDTAEVLVAAVAHPAGSRYLVPGTTVEAPHEPLAQVTGRRLPFVAMPAAIVAAAAMPGYVTGLSFLPGAAEGVRYVGCGNPVDSSATTRELGVRARPFADSLTDTVRWLVAAGHVSPKVAGRLGAAPS
jgi:dihydroflavonol-4-reductase